MENQVEEIKKKIDIVEYIGSFISLKRTGRNFKGLCPFHKEKTPSFYVSPDRQFWYCFGACQEGGDVIKFLMKWENIIFVEALRDLADKAGVKLQKLSFEDKAWKKRERLLSLNTLAAEFFEYILQKSKFGQRALDYLQKRSLNEKTIKKFQLGYAPESWDSLLRFLRSKKYETGEIFEAGLLVVGERGNYYDRFRSRVVFPIKDARGNVVGFSGRTMNDKEGGAKYINTPETPLYHKRETLYGIDVVKDAVRKSGNATLVEGEFDMIVPYEHGVENVVAIKGSAVTQEQLMLLKRYTNSITLALDSDAAGEEAAKRGIAAAESLDFEIGVVTFDFGKDPDEAVRNDPARFKKAINSPLPVYDYIISTSQKKYQGNDPFSKKKIGDSVVPYIAGIRNPIVFSHYVKKLAALLDVSDASIESLIRKFHMSKRQKVYIERSRETEKKEAREVMLQKYLLSMIFQSDKPYKISDSIFRTLETDDFSLESHKKIIDAFLQYKKKNKDGFEMRLFLSRLPSQLTAVFDEIYLFASAEFEFQGENVEKLALEVKKYSLKRKIAGLISQDRELDGKEALQKLSLKLKEVEKRLFSL